MFWCFLYRCNDCAPLRITSIITFTGREHIRIPFDWRNFARCTRHRWSLLRLLWQKSVRWHLSKGHNVRDLSALIFCYKTREQTFVGNNRGAEGIDVRSTESCFHVGCCGCFILCFSENLAEFLLGESAICDVVIKQMNQFIQLILTWSKERFLHRFNSMSNLTWKV